MRSVGWRAGTQHIRHAQRDLIMIFRNPMVLSCSLQKLTTNLKTLRTFLYRSAIVEPVAGEIKGVEADMTAENTEAAAKAIDSIKYVIVHHPALLSYSPETLRRKLEENLGFFEAQGLNRKQSTEILRSCPTLVSLRVARLQESVDALSNIHTNPMQAEFPITDLLRRYPRVLCLSPTTLRRKLDSMLTVCNGDAATLWKALHRRPTLLGCREVLLLDSKYLRQLCSAGTGG
jgi:hypothetical protein